MAAAAVDNIANGVANMGLRVKDKLPLSDKDQAANVRKELAKALPPRLVHPFDRVRRLTKAFDPTIDIQVPVTSATLRRFAACEGYDEDTEKALDEWFEEDTGLAFEDLDAVQSASNSVLKTIHETTQASGVVKSSGEAVVQAPLDTLVFRLLEQLDDPDAPFEFITHRNVKTSTASKATGETSGSLSISTRPDTQVVARWLFARPDAVEVVCLVGEDKAAEESGKALAQLEEPYRFVFGPTTHGTMESLLAITCTGAHVRFYELTGPAADGTMQAKALWGDDALDVRNPGDRVRLVGLALRLYRVLRGLVEFHAPTFNFNAAAHAKDKGRPGQQVTIRTTTEGWFVEKPISADVDAIKNGMQRDEKRAALNDLKAIYEAVCNETTGTRFIINGALDTKRERVETEDVGFRRIPRTVDEALLALTCVLEALAWLHAQGVVHRDLRWPNVLKIATNRFILIDLELCAKLEKGTAPWPTNKMLHEKFWPPREAGDATRWTPRHDLQQMLEQMWSSKKGVPDGVLGAEAIKDVLKALKVGATAKQGLELPAIATKRKELEEEEERKNKELQESGATAKATTSSG